MSWLASGLILLGLILINRRNTLSFLFMALGNFIWLYFAISNEMLSLAVVSGTFSIVSIINLCLSVRKKEKFALYVGPENDIGLQFKKTYRLVEQLRDQHDNIMFKVVDESGKDYKYPEFWFWIIPDKN